MIRKPRIYADTSVFGGCIDEEFAEESTAFLRMAREQKFTLLLSDVLADELVSAPREVQHLLSTLPSTALEQVISSRESEQLRDLYLRAHVVGPRHVRDAHHIALATVVHADLLVSWNFRHIVHWEKIRLFNAVNLRSGYGPIEIRSPREVV